MGTFDDPTQVIYGFTMSVTVDIDDDVLAVARAMAERDGISFGRAISDLARRGIGTTSLLPDDVVSEAIFAVEPDAEPITSEDVYRALGDWP